MSADGNSVSAPGGDSAPFNEKAVFVAALALKPAEQEAFLQGACPGDAERTRVRTLLERHAEASTEGLRTKAEQADMGVRGDSGQDQVIAEFELPCRIGDFELRREIGRGGMGVVYLARDLTLERDVAVKMLEPRYGASAKFLASFKQEAVLASQLRHPAIVPVFRFGDHKGTPFIVTPYIEGETLRERLCVFEASPRSASDARAWRREVAGVLATIAEALDRAHAEGIVHRDVKPSNIIIDGAGRPHLLDFGISMRAGDGESLLPTAQMGSSAYASPEQLAGGPIDGLSDVYSLGIVLFECLTTMRPFDHADRSADPKHPVAPHARRIDRTIPVDLDVICHNAMELTRDDRYQSAAHIAADLRAWLADRPILARPDPMPRRVRRWVGRQRPAVLSGTAAAVTLAATAIGFWIAQDPRPRLILKGVPEDARIVAQPLTVPLGSPGGEWSEIAARTRMEPGWYRILVASTDGTQAEFSRWLAPDTTTRLLIRPVDQLVAVDGMIRIDPAIDPPHPSSINFPGFSY
ncbi:MAG: serine/threonine-protein kinase, partial [Planctomycetota bacterium]